MKTNNINQLAGRGNGLRCNESFTVLGGIVILLLGLFETLIQCLRDIPKPSAAMECHSIFAWLNQSEAAQLA